MLEGCVEGDIIDLPRFELPTNLGFYLPEYLHSLIETLQVTRTSLIQWPRPGPTMTHKPSPQTLVPPEILHNRSHEVTAKRYYPN